MRRGGRFLTIAALSIVCTGAGWVQLNEAGKAAYSRGELAEAERLFREAIAAAPEEPLSHYHRGVALTRLLRFEEAAAAYQRALRLNPPSSIASAARAGLRTVEPMTRLHTVDEGLPPPARRPARPPRSELPGDSVRLRRSWGNWFVDV